MTYGVQEEHSPSPISHVPRPDAGAGALLFLPLPRIYLPVIVPLGD